MPLRAGKAKRTINKNIEEFHTGQTYKNTEKKFGKETADKQAVAAALSKSRKKKK